MASNSFVIKCKTKACCQTIDSLTAYSTVRQLKICLEKTFGIPSGAIKILSGFPPKALNVKNDNNLLKDINIQSGDTLIVELESSSNDTTLGNIQPPVSEDYNLNLGGIMLRHVVPSDNSCLFASVHFLLSSGGNDPAQILELRRIIAITVTHNAAKYNSTFLGMSNAEYCQYVLNPTNWGGAIELQILSEYFHIELIAVDAVSEIMHRFGEAFSFENRAFLIFDGIHYDPLCMELGTDVQTIFKSDDPVSLEMAMEIAREARSSRQFTDVANFVIVCKDCGTNLHGEGEARTHALKTGHSRFDEI